MKRTLILLAALGLASADLPAADPAPTHALTLDPAGKPTADLNLSSPHFTGTLDPARLPAGIGSAFLPGVNRPTGTDPTALDHVDVGAIAVGDVRQMIFTSGLAGFEGGADYNTGVPFTFAAATYRLVATPTGSVAAAPYLLGTLASGKSWLLVSAVLSNGDVCGPNGNLQSHAARLNQGNGGGSIDTSGGGGPIDTSGGGGYIRTAGGGSIDTTGGGNILTGGPIDTTSGGAITTGYQGIDTSGGGYLATAGSIDTTGGGSIVTGGNIDTSGGGGLIATNGHGSPEGVVSGAVGSLYTDQDGTPGHVLYVKEPGSDGSHGWAAK